MATKFSFEVPIAHLKEFEPFQDYTFALSYLLTDKEYDAYYWRQKVSSSLVILDNSFNETQEPETVEHMASLYWKYKPDFIMAPDSDQWGEHHVIKTLHDMLHEVPENRVMGIYKSMEEWDAMENMNFPRNQRAVSFFWRESFPKDFPFPCSHFLGFLNPEEVKKYQPKTLDTSMPIKIALEGLTHEEWVEKGCPHIHTKDDVGFFDRVMTPEQIKLAIANILALKGVCNGK